MGAPTLSTWGRPPRGANNVGLRKRYPTRTLVPFARREGNDDAAFWDLDVGGVAVVHDLCEVGHEQRERYPDFYSWLRQAINDLIEHDC